MMFLANLLRIAAVASPPANLVWYLLARPRLRRPCLLALGCGEGREWSLKLGTVNATSQGDAIEGTAQLTARRAAEAKQLEVSFRAGTKIPAVPEHESPYFTK
jgi:hypothetical protein